MRNYFSTLALLLILLSATGQDQQKVDSLNAVISKIKDVEAQFPALIQLSEILTDNKPELALEYVKQAYENSTNPAHKLDASIRLAEMYNNRIEYEIAMEYTLKSIKYATELEDKKSIASAYRILGLINMYIGEYEESSEYLFYSLKLYEEEESINGKARVLSNIGTLYFINENYDKSLEYVVKSIELSEKIKDTVGISANLNNLAACYASLEMYDNVLKYIHQAISLNKKSGLNVQIGINYQNLGEFYNDIKSYDSAFFYFRKAENTYLAEESYTYLPNLYIDLSEYYRNIQNKEFQTKYSLMAFELAEKYNLKKSKLVSAGLLYDIYLSNEDYENACHYGAIQYELKYNLRLMESLVKLSQLEFQYHYDKKEVDRKNTQQKRDLIIFFTLIILVLFSIVLLLLFASQKNKVKNSRLEQQRLLDEVEFKNKELTTNVMGLIKKNEILAEISDKLIQITHKTVQKETKNEIYKLSREIEQTMDSKIWEEFEKRFSLVHNKFYSKLVDKYPNLTPNELKLCAFLRLNLTSKDICELTGQQLSAIEVARYRLRKKLNISNSQVNLVTFLSQI